MVEEAEKDPFYPQPELRKEGHLEVSEKPPHRLYWAEYGNPDGEPVLFIHGGPGSGCKPKYARFFDPDHYRIILLDQRGAGKSQPNAADTLDALENNTTQASIQDIEKVRDALGIEGKMHLFGGSWGSTLSLAYAIAHPKNVSSMMLRGIFLCRKHDLEVFYQGDAADPGNPSLQSIQSLFPEQWPKVEKYWSNYVNFIPEEERGDMIAAYNKRLMNFDDPETQLQAAKHWSVWEAATSTAEPSADLEEEYSDPSFALRFAIIENHYFMNRIFLGDESSREQNHIIENVAKIVDIPTEIVEGELDMVCPIYQARDLVAAWESAQPDPAKHPKLHVIEGNGHNMMEPGVKVKLVEITDRFRLLSKSDREIS